jgi:hypothetical protein
MHLYGLLSAIVDLRDKAAEVNDPDNMAIWEVMNILLDSLLDAASSLIADGAIVVEVAGKTELEINRDLAAAAKMFQVDVFQVRIDAKGTVRRQIEILERAGLRCWELTDVELMTTHIVVSR